MRTIIRLFDRFLQRVLGVYEFCDDPNCLFRARVTEAPHAISLPDGEIPAGAKVLELHFWSEHFPRIPPEGPSFALALKGVRMLTGSFRAVAREVQHNPCLADAQAVGGVNALIYPDAGPASEQLLRRLGFTIFPYHNPLGRFGEFWENLYTWALIWTFNEVSLRERRLLRVKRCEIWMSVDDLVRLHGEDETSARDREDRQPAQTPMSE